MRVIIVNDFAHVEGGASHVAISSAIGLAARGHQVSYLSAVEPVTPALLEAGVHVWTTGQYQIAADPSRLRAVLQGIWNWSSARGMDALLVDADPRSTIVHLHGWTKALSSSVMRGAVRRGVPIVCTLNDYFTACPNGGFFEYPRGQTCTRVPLGPSCLVTQCDKRSYGQKIWRVLRQVVQQRWGLVPGGIRHFITVSSFSRDILRPYLPAGARLYALPNLIDIPRHPPVLVRENTAYTMVGRLSQEKGPILFAGAAAQAGVEAVFIGDGECRPEVLRTCPSAQVKGWCSKVKVIEHLRRARALVFPSLWYEAQPLAVREAAAMGVPAIVSDRCAARDDVVDGQTGLWFNAGDAGDLMAKIRELQDDLTVETMGRAAYVRYWSAPATPESHVAHLEKIYAEMLEGQSSRGS